MEWIPQAFIQATEWALSLLPDSPFLALDALDNSEFYVYIRYLNWFLPVNLILSVMSLWCAAILTYYVVQIVLRWAKAIN